MLEKIIIIHLINVYSVTSFYARWALRHLETTLTNSDITPYLHIVNCIIIQAYIACVISTMKKYNMVEWAHESTIPDLVWLISEFVGLELRSKGWRKWNWARDSFHVRRGRREPAYRRRGQERMACITGGGRAIGERTWNFTLCEMENPSMDFQ